MVNAAQRHAERAEQAFDGERNRNALLTHRLQDLEASLRVASVKEDHLNREAEVFRARGGAQELVNQKLRLDMQDVINSNTPPGSPVASPAVKRPDSADRRRRPGAGTSGG